MKKLIGTIVFMLAFAYIKLNAQNTFPASGSTGIGTATPNASALLEVKSTTKGMLTPRMTKAQRDLIASPATGLLIFQTNSTPGFYYFDGSVWKAVSSTNFPNKTLSNLTGPTKINADLLPDTSGTIDLGSDTRAWKNIFLSGKIFLDGEPFIHNTAGNVFMGITAGQSTTGPNNTFVGSTSGAANTTGEFNSFFGALAGQSNTTGAANTFFGSFSGRLNTASSNSFFGAGAGSGNTTGSSNCFFGIETGGSNNIGSSNSYFGANAGSNSPAGSDNVFIGQSAGFVNNANGNTFVGSRSGDANTTGNRNAFFGKDAGGANTTASDNSFFGHLSGSVNTTGNNNSFFGSLAGDANTTGKQNAFFGSNSGGSNNIGDNNSFFGDSSGRGNTIGARNSFFGKNAGKTNSTATDNSFFGVNAGAATTTGISNSFFGGNAGAANTQASNNSFFGFHSGDHTTTGIFNAFFGAAAGTLNINGNNNAFFGAGAGISNTVSDNAFFGTSAGEATTIGPENCFFGKDAGLDNVNGTGVVAVGFQADKTRSNSFCTFIGYQSDNVTANNLSNANAFGHISRVTAANQVRIGNTSVGSIGGFVGFTNLSDGRYKKNVKQNVPGLEFINKLNPVTYTMDVKGLQTFLHENDNLNESVKAINLKAAEDKEKVVYTGFIAQEVEAAAKELNYDFSGVDKPNNEESLYGLRYAEFTVPLVKAVQELNEKLMSEVGSQKSEIEELKSEVRSLKSELSRQNSGTNSGMVRVAVSEESNEALLGQNLPNPFDNSTIIPFRIPKECHSATIIITETTGKIVRAVPVSCKETQLSLDAGILVQGVYTYSLIVDGVAVDTKQMILQK